jgi:SSS family solute:Na+ symporter
MARILIVISGVLALLVATLYVYMGGQGILGFLFGLYAIFSGGIVGMFLLGLFCKRANKQGLYVGLIACVLFTAYAVLTSTKFNGQLVLDLGDWNFVQHKYMLGVYSHLIEFVVGYLASFLFPKPAVEERLTIYGYWKERQAEKAQTA